ncbi:isopentenyl-diphosphate Delta-isomerase [archaeon]|nr:isopentenyl-diphosphate Delta-isomerase [archaeon]
MIEKVILVDKFDNEIGEEEKLLAHKKGLLHRAISNFVFNSKGELLIQQRALEKYHCPGLWANTCCSHPRPNEKTINAAYRRLPEEMGFSAPLKYIGKFIYKINFENGLTEYEIDHVFKAIHDGKINPNPNEVNDYKWINPKILKKEIKLNPKNYTIWLDIALNLFF